jgi:hypothetical protein
MPIARQRIAKHVSAEDVRSNGTSIASQRRGWTGFVNNTRCFPWRPRKVVVRELTSEAGSSVELSVQQWSVNQRATEA